MQRLTNSLSTRHVLGLWQSQVLAVLQEHVLLVRLIGFNMTEQVLEAEYNAAKSEMNWLFAQMASASWEMNGPLSVREELIQAYEKAKERRRLAFNALCNYQINN